MTFFQRSGFRFQRLGLGCVFVLCFAAQVDAQEKNELSVTVSGEFIPSNALATGSGARAIQYSNSLALDFDYGRQIHRFRRTEIWLDVPAVVGPSHRTSGGSPQLSTSLATFYVTPSARIAFPTGHAWTPWVSAGGGYGLFETSDLLQGGASNPKILTHTGVLQFGGGVDVKTPLRLLVPIGLRGEFRDFYALTAPFSVVPLTEGSQHNLTVGAGLTVRF